MQISNVNHEISFDGVLANYQREFRFYKQYRRCLEQFSRSKVAGHIFIVEVSVTE